LSEARLEGGRNRRSHGSLDQEGKADHRIIAPLLVQRQHLEEYGPHQGSRRIRVGKSGNARGNSL
jgi:hypothetical protein